jgi:hypothetical protein
LGSAEKDSMLFDNTFRGSKYKSKNENFDYKKILLEQKKINKDFLNRVKLLSLEELIYLKLDAISSSLNGKLLGFPIMKMLPDICKEAFVLFALSVTKNQRDASVMLKTDRFGLINYMKKYNINVGEKNDRSNKSN